MPRHAYTISKLRQNHWRLALSQLGICQFAAKDGEKKKSKTATDPFAIMGPANAKTVTCPWSTAGRVSRFSRKYLAQPNANAWITTVAYSLARPAPSPCELAVG
jgi:hypothetical protein